MTPMGRSHLVQIAPTPRDPRRTDLRKKSFSQTASHEKTTNKKNSCTNSNKVMNSVVKGVSKLTLCKNTSSYSGPVDIDDYYYEVGNDDGSHTTETATVTSISRSSGHSRSHSGHSSHCSSSSRDPQQSSVVSPSRICQGPSVRTARRHSLEEIAIPPKAKHTLRRHSLEEIVSKSCHYTEALSRWSEAQQQQFVSKPALTNYGQNDDESGIVYQGTNHHHQAEKTSSQQKGWDVDAYIGDVDAFIIDDDDEFSMQMEGYLDDRKKAKKDGYEDPPLSAQTNYAKEQLMKSTRYQELQKRTKQKKEEQQQQEQEEYDIDVDLYFDEVDISRGLGGYEEGFEIPSLSDHHEYHHLPYSIREEDELSVASSVPLFEPTWSNPGISKATSVDSVEQELPSQRNSACVHCRNGTCENQDCSGSRFMI